MALLRTHIDVDQTPIGQAVMAKSQPVAIASDQTPIPVNATLAGGTAVDVTDRAPRLLGHATIDNAGQQLSANSLPVVLASDVAETWQARELRRTTEDSTLALLAGARVTPCGRSNERFSVVFSNRGVR